MKIEIAQRLVILAIAGALIFPTFTSGARLPRIELLREIQITGARLRLSDLLPENAPDSLRSRAQEISLGAAPQPGSTRNLDNVMLVSRMSGENELLSEISIPERMVISRQARPITALEVLNAIHAALEHAGVDAATILSLEDIQLQSQVLVSPGNAGLQVVRMEVDRGLRRARFLLWPSNDPAVLPFIVVARLSGDLPSTQFRGARLTGTSKQPDVKASAAAVRQEVLVGPGEPATLVLHSASFRMFAEVTAMERGALGQQIRVRVIDTGKIFSARVDGRGHLEVNF